MSAEKPSLRRVLSDTSRVIRSNPLHFLALSLLFIFPVSLLSLIRTQTMQPAPPIHSHYRRLLSAVSGSDSDSDFDSEIPPFDKSQLMSQSLYVLLLLIFNLCATSSVTHSIFHGLNAKKAELPSSLKSILSSFFPLFATNLLYIAIMVAIVFGTGISLGIAFLGLTLLGFHIEPSSKPFAAVAVAAAVLLLVLFVYLSLKWFFTDTVVVVESKHGYGAFERSSKLMKGGRRVALLMALFFSVLSAILSGLYSALGGGGGDGGCTAGVVVMMVAYAGFSTALTLFGMATKTVLFVQCKALNDGESEIPVVYDKLGQVYVQLPHDVAAGEV